ncbi:MAG: hypothetical protein L0229_18180 [Blastocatellia bacterium]|nr:hypothetical protein [Blastocatellia bacterium]
MVNVELPSQSSIEHLLEEIKQLSPAELREFARQFAEWQEQSCTQEEASLLARIEENSRLPDAEQQRYELLRRKCERRTLIENELVEYQSLLQRLEARNVKRVESLIALAELRRMSLRDLRHCT